MSAPNARIPRMNDAIAFYRGKLRQDPNNAASHHYLAPLLLAQGNVLAALRHYRHAYQLNPRDINSKNDLAIVLWRLGKSEAALAALCQVVAVDNDHFEGHVNLAVAYYEIGHYDIALKHAKKATQLRPRDPSSHRLLGQVLDETGNSSRALHHRMIAIRRGANAAGMSDRMHHPQHLYTYKKVAAQLVIGKDRARESGHAFMDAYRAMSGKRVELAHSERTREILHNCLR